MPNKRKVQFMISAFDDPNKILSKHKHRMFVYLPSEKRFIFNSKYNKQELEITYALFEIDKNAESLFKKIENEALVVAEKFSGEPIEPALGRSIGDAAINSVHKYSHLENFSIFDICTDVFISILNGHCLGNGNKRSAFSFLKLLLGSFGYYLMYSDIEWIGNSSHVTLIENFAESLEKEEDVFNCPTRERIKEWIIKNVIISYEGEVEYE